MSATPGPWRYQGELERAHGRPDRMRYEIYTASGKYGHPATCDLEPDARLIASAPELLAALHDALADLSFYAGSEHPTLVKMRSAIAKAEGR